MWNVKDDFVRPGFYTVKAVLIETLWNVKGFDKVASTSTFAVLIETLWNVKLIKGIIEPVIGEVLIETLWNVKDIKVFNLLEEAFSINRNIVECKALH